MPKENIWFIIALGTHGVMYRTEFVRKLGEEIVENYEVHNHTLFFNHVFVGNTTNNVPVEINADVMSADYKIAIGTTMAHSYYGFSGGAKCILPGVSSCARSCATTASRRRRSSTWATPTRSCAATPSRPRA